MDSFEWNKILGAILGTLLFLFVVKEAAHIIYPSEEHVDELAYKVEIPETEAGRPGEAKPEPVDFGTLLQQASAEQGATVAKRCLQCHTFEKGGPTKTGPNLWGILGADIAADPGFRYSNALSKLEGEWTYERVYEFVGAPSRYVPGTNMNFAGLRRRQQRIDLLAYMRTRADQPPPLPEPLPAEPEEGAEAADGEGETPAEEGSTPAEAESGEGASEEGTDDAAADAAGTEEQPSGEETAPAEDAPGGDVKPDGNNADKDKGENTARETDSGAKAP